MAGPIRISILADDRASRVFTSVGATAGGMSARVGRAGKFMGAAVFAGSVLAGAAVAKFGADSVKAGSAAQQSLGATETVFGRYAKTVIKRSNEAATAIGISANEYRELSNVVGASLTGAGVSIQRATVLTGDLNKRAADMAATFGGTTREAVEAVSSALRGETDPIERYGVSIKQVDVNARLAARGQDELTGAALKSAEMSARLDLIFEKTAKTQGAFARESDTLAHQQQVLSAQWENLKAKIGTALLPVLTRLFTFLNANLMPAFAAVSAAISPVVAWIKNLGDGAGAGQSQLSALSTFLTTQVVPAVQGVITAYQNLVGVLLPIIRQVADTIISKWSEIQPQVRSIWGSVQNIVVDALAILQRVVQLGTAAIAKVWDLFGADVLRLISRTMGNVATFLKGAFQILEGLFKTVSSVLRGDWSGAWDGIKKIAEGALNVIRGAVSQAMAMIQFAFSAGLTILKGIASKAWDGIVAAVKAGVGLAVDHVRGMKDRVTGVFKGARDWLLQAGKDILAGLGDGIDAARQWVMDKIHAVGDLIPDWLKKRLGIASPSKVMRNLAKWIPAGIAAGIRDGERTVSDALDRVTDVITKAMDKRFKGAETADRATRIIISGLRDERAELIANERQYDRVLDKLDAAKTKLRDIVKEARDYARSVRDTVISSADVTQFTGEDGSGTYSNANMIVQGVRDRLAKAQAYAKAMQDLVTLGLNDTMIEQIRARGIDDGLVIAQALAGGPHAAIAELNSLTQQLNAVGGGLGNELADTMYGTGIGAAQSLVNALESQTAALRKTGRRLARAFARALQDELDKIHVTVSMQTTAEKVDAAQRAATAERASSSSTTTAAAVQVNINVTAPVGSSSADIGRELEGHLSEFFRAGGRQLALG